MGIDANATMTEAQELPDAQTGVAHEQQTELEPAAGLAKALLQGSIEVWREGSREVLRQLGQVRSAQERVCGNCQRALLVEPA